MIHLFKNLNIGGLVVLVVGVVLMVSWTGSTANSVSLKWYQVQDNRTAPNQPENLVITGEFLGGEPTGLCSSDDDLRPICAKELELPSSVTFPITMEDVIDNSYPQGEERHLDEE